MTSAPYLWYDAQLCAIIAFVLKLCLAFVLFIKFEQEAEESPLDQSQAELVDTHSDRALLRKVVHLRLSTF